MKNNLIAKAETTINVPAEKVWDALTNPILIKKYMFDTNATSDWTEGSSILLIDGDTKPVNIGQVLQSVPGMLLQFGFREENTSTYLITTYELILAGEGVELKMRCEGFNATHQEYLIRVQQSNLLLQKIKWLSEYS